jgi:hypothetical protein
MGNYTNFSQLQDATYGLYNTVDDDDKFLIDIGVFVKLRSYSKPYNDANALEATPDIPILYIGAPVQFIAILFNSCLSIPSDPVDLCLYSPLRNT